MPIFNEIKKTENSQFHVLQFTWASTKKIKQVKAVAASLGIHYTAAPVYRKPVASVGSLFSIFKGIYTIENYIKKHKIDVVISRSTMPAVMVNRLRLKNVKVVFDADGFPLEERVDFSGLSKESKQYAFFKKEETKLLKKANGVITRSQKAIEIHLQTIGETYRNKFSVVYNGRDVSFFQPELNSRLKIREALGFNQEDTVFVYCGSLGPQYGWEEMIAVFHKYHAANNKAKFLILSGNQEYASERIPVALKDFIIVKSIPFHEVPKYLNCADIAFAIRKPTFSMQAVAPIKLGEYLLLGLPKIASKGIGDTDVILQQIPHCFLFNHDNPNAVEEAVVFALNVNNHHSKEAIRKTALNYFSLEKSAESYITALQKI